MTTTMSNTERIAELFPDLMAIADADLRDRVASVWDEAITTGCGGKGWSVEELRAIPFTLLAGDIDLRYIEHLNSCVKQCMAIADVCWARSSATAMPIHRDYLIAGALLADVGKPLEFDKDAVRQRDQRAPTAKMLRHPFSGVGMCYKHGVPPEVMHIVATHSHEGDKVQRSIESIIFHHADFVDFDIARLAWEAVSLTLRMHAEIREAIETDAPAVSSLLDELEHPADVELVTRRLREMIGMEHCALLVAVEDGQVVGMGTLQMQPVVHKPGPIGRITTMIVTARCRGRGVGQAIVEALEARASEAGCKRMEVTSHNRRDDAHRFYVRLGYEDTSKRFIKTL